ncbi:MAG: Calx-beta domain-containing protein, partial [Acidobacteriota bacterium]
FTEDSDDLYIYNLTTKTQTKIVDEVGTDAMPDWSAKAGKIVFANRFNYLGGTYYTSFNNIFTVRPDGSNLTDLTGYDEWDEAYPDSPRWSPDGTKIMCSNRGAGQAEFLQTMNADGSGVKGAAVIDGIPITTPVWSPDGRYFICQLTGRIGRFSMDLSDKGWITPDTSTCYPMDWKIIPSATKPTVTITATDASASEAGLAVGKIKISRTGSTANPLTVYLTVTGTATPGSDYVKIPASVTINSGFAAKVITIKPIDDTAKESDETVGVTVVPKTAYNVGASNKAIVTIISNE